MLGSKVKDFRRNEAWICTLDWSEQLGGRCRRAENLVEQVFLMRVMVSVKYVLMHFETVFCLAFHFRIQSQKIPNIEYSLSLIGFKSQQFHNYNLECHYTF
jgi:hypothetical protein